MAILYGTTADGDSLPVEVNELGQLVAEGLPGQQGPPGPPGVGQLPPDPFEGAILGWKDNTLAWLGGAVPIPENTFGPILSYENGILELENVPDYPYLTRIFMSDETGAVSSYFPTSSPITAIKQSGLSPSLAGRSVGNTSVGMTELERGFDGYDDTWWGFARDDSVINPVKTKQWDFNVPWPIYKGETIEIIAAWANVPYPSIRFTDETSISVQEGVVSMTETKYVSNVSTALGGTQNRYGQIFGYKRNGQYIVPGGTATFLQLQDDFGLNDFKVGDFVQPGVQILEIRPDLGTGNEIGIFVDGGTWSGGDRVTTLEPKSGLGSVQSVVGNSIVLREDNKAWLPGRYVTSEETRVAARYVYASTKRSS